MSKFKDPAKDVPLTVLMIGIWMPAFVILDTISLGNKYYNCLISKSTPAVLSPPTLPMSTQPMDLLSVVQELIMLLSLSLATMIKTRLIQMVSTPTMCSLLQQLATDLMINNNIFYLTNLSKNSIQHHQHHCNIINIIVLNIHQSQPQSSPPSNYHKYTIKRLLYNFALSLLPIY